MALEQAMPLPEPSPAPAGPLDLTRSWQALTTLGAAAALGWWGDALLHTDHWGLNLSLWIAAVALIGWLLVIWRGLPRARHDRWLLAPVLFFAFGFAWRASPWLLTFDALALIVAASVPFWRGLWRQSTLGRALIGVIECGASTAFGAVPLVGLDIKWSALRREGALRRVFAVGWGLALAVPVLLVFGGLFMSADARFEALVKGLFKLDLDGVITHGFLIGFLAWATAGYLRGVCWPDTAEVLPEVRSPWSLGLIEVATVLVLIDALFAVFVGLQLPYLFGGMGLVASQQGLTFAEYARRGFFELATVTALVLPLLLALHGLLDRAQARAERVYRVLAGLMLGLLGVIIASAMQRMLLYQGEYGLTALRVYVLAFEVWMIGVLGWFAWTVLRGAHERFLWGALVWGFAAGALMHLPNWEALIARTNIGLAASGHAVDVAYLGTLSADAVPALIAGRKALPDEQRGYLAWWLLHHPAPTQVQDWRAWSWARARATAAWEAEKKALQQEARVPPSERGSEAE